MNPPLIVAVANRKGGTGKTTTAVNVAAEWASHGYRTLLVDLDSQAHAGYGVGCAEPGRDGPFVHGMFCDSQFEFSKVIRSTPIDHLWLAPADRNFEETEIDGRAEVLRLHLADETIGSRFDRVVLDTPPTLDIASVSALASANAVLVPFLPHFLSEVGVGQLARLFYKVATRYNRGLRLLALLPVMMNRRTNLHRHVLNKLKQQFGERKMMQGIRTNVQLAEAFAAGRPVRHYAPKSRGATDYRDLVRELEDLLVHR